LKKNLFVKYIFRTFLVLIITLTVLGVALTAIISGYLIEEKQKLLYENAQNVSRMTAELAESNNMVVDSRMQSMMVLLGKSISADLFIAGNNGETLYCSCTQTPCPHTENKTPAKVMDEVKAGEYNQIGTLGHIYTQRNYIVGLPIKITDGTVVGAVFAVAPVVTYEAFRSEIVKMFVISAALSLALSFFVLFFLNYKMVMPLRAMVTAAKAFGQGDFSKRVPVLSEDEIGQLSAAFNNMAVSLSSLEGMRRSFVANTSHELRTPMTTIAGFIDGILDGTIEEDKREYYLKLVSDEVKRLSRLVKSMLDLSRIDSGQMELHRESFDISEVICRTLLSFEHRIEEKKVDVRGLDHLEKMEVCADPDLIHQVLYNLLDNAVKFTDEQGVIEVDAYEKDDKIWVSVKNSGIGVKEEEMAHIFDRFYKTDQSRSVDKRGVGLGLYIVKNIISLHEGDIVVHSVENSYCQFEFCLPAGKRK